MVVGFVNAGLLTLKHHPSQPGGLTKRMVDWTHTRAWAGPGQGKIYLNLAGREAQGCLAEREAPALVEKMTRALNGIKDGQGRPIPVRAVVPRKEQHIPLARYGPDLLVQFDQGRYVTDDRVGYGRVLSFDEVMDDMAQSGPGCFFLTAPGLGSVSGPVPGCLLDVAPTVLDLMNQPAPTELEGGSLYREIKGDRFLINESNRAMS